MVRASHTGRDQIRSAADSLNRTGVRVLGTVFSMVAAFKGKGYGYGYGYGAELPVPRASAGREGPAEAAAQPVAGEK